MKNLLIVIIGLFLSEAMLQAQTDTMFVMKAGVVINKQSIKLADVDSVIFYKPVNFNPRSNIQIALIPAGMFTMGSPVSEVGRNTDETQFVVTLSAFSMSKYDITNAQFAAFLNAKNIGRYGLYPAGAYPTQTLIYDCNVVSGGARNFGLLYSGTQWTPVAGYENNPVIDVTWYGATCFATYVGGTLPTEAQWEYACRAGTTTPFYTGTCLTNLQAKYDWSHPYGSCTNTVTFSPAVSMPVGTYPANNYADWYGTYPTTNYPTTVQNNPTGPVSGLYRVVRGTYWAAYAQNCRSALRQFHDPLAINYDRVGFRVVFLP